MGISRDEIWNQLESLAAANGVRLFDLDYPSINSSQPVLRVYICQPDGSPKGIGLQQCTQIARLINDLSNVEDLMPGDTTLEVSSPGVNRRLRRSEHFGAAVGERVKLSVEREPSAGAEAGARKKKEVVRGLVRSFNGVELEIVRDGKEVVVEKIPLSSVTEARVDFQFEG